MSRFAQYSIKYHHEFAPYDWENRQKHLGALFEKDESIVFGVGEPSEEQKAKGEVYAKTYNHRVCHLANNPDIIVMQFANSIDIPVEIAYQCNVILPFTSISKTNSYELYQYNHFNRLPREEGVKCPFCRLSRKVEVICETATCVAFYDGYPVSPGHALIIPKRHVASYFELTNHEREAMNVMLQYVKTKLDERSILTAITLV